MIRPAQVRGRLCRLMCDGDPIAHAGRLISPAPAAGRLYQGRLRMLLPGRYNEGGTMFWFWLNIPMAAACFAAWCGIPLWMVLRHPNWGPEPGHGPYSGHSGQRPGLEPIFLLSHSEYPADVATVGAGTGR